MKPCKRCEVSNEMLLALASKKWKRQFKGCAGCIFRDSERRGAEKVRIVARINELSHLAAFIPNSYRLRRLKFLNSELAKVK